MEQQVKRMEIRNLSKTFFSKKGYFTAIDNVSFDVYDGEFLVILGPGRCGKTVMLNIIAGVEDATEGQIIYNGKEWKGLNPEIGMVFQKLALMSFKTVIENVELALKFRGMKKEERREIARHYIKLVGLEGKMSRHPHEMSGGEQQRLAIARALVNNPSTIIADEPTGNLDPERSFEIMALLQEINNLGTTVLVVTHAQNLVELFNKRVIAIDEGLVVSDGTEEENEDEAE